MTQTIAPFHDCATYTCAVAADGTTDCGQTGCPECGSSSVSVERYADGTARGYCECGEEFWTE